MSTIYCARCLEDWHIEAQPITVDELEAGEAITIEKGEALCRVHHNKRHSREAHATVHVMQEPL